MKLILLIINFLCSIHCFAQSTDELMKSGNAQFGVGNYTAALPYFEQASLQQAKKSSFMAGLCLYNLTNYKAANHYFDIEISKDSTCAQAYYVKALIASATLSVALLSINKAIALQPTNNEYLLTKSNLYYNHKYYTEAILNYTQLLALNNTIDDAHYKLGYCKLYTNDTLAACQSWRKISELDDFENEAQITQWCKTR